MRVSSMPEGGPYELAIGAVALAFTSFKRNPNEEQKGKRRHVQITKKSEHEQRVAYLLQFLLLLVNARVSGEACHVGGVRSWRWSGVSDLWQGAGECGAIASNIAVTDHLPQAPRAFFRLSFSLDAHTLSHELLYWTNITLAFAVSLSSR